MRTSTWLSAIMMFVVLLGGCKKDDPDETNPSGNIKGQIKLTDEFGHDLSSHSGMKVSVQTGEYSVSDLSGAFTINGLKSGTYTLYYEKSGFGTFKKFNIQVNSSSAGTTLFGIDYLGMKSTTEIGNLSAAFNTNDSTYTIGCDVNPVPDTNHPRAFRLFFGNSAYVNYQNYIHTPASSWVSTTATGNITGFSRQDLYAAGLNRGDSVYVVAYGESIRTNVYTVPGETKKTYPNINETSPSNVVGFVLE